MGFHPPQLPKELRDHIYQTEGLSGGQRRRSNRKDSRKQERLQQKRKNREHLSKNDTRDVPSKRRPDLELSDGPRKRVKLSKVDQSTNIGGLVKSSTGAHQSCSHDDALSLSANRSRTPKIDPIDLLQNGQATDEAEEGWLESKLGYSNGQVATKSYGFQYEDDGLDGRKDLLMTLDGIVGSVHRQHGPAEGSHNSESDRSNAESEDGEDASDMEDGESWNGLEGTSEEESNSVNHQPGNSEAPPSIHSGEQLLAASRRYIPPRLSASVAESDQTSETMVRLTRRLKGLLNRMTEQNIGTILDSIEECYRGYRRHDVTSALATLMVDGVASHSALIDTHVILLAALVSILHKVIGIEFVAFFVQQAVSSFDGYYPKFNSAASSNEDRGKECSNLIILIAELYNFRVVSCLLLYDIIRQLLASDLGDFDVELLLKVTRSSGSQLRQDDPLALKDIIQMVHTKVSRKTEGISSRTKFMIETLTNLKNNKAKLNERSNVASEAIERLKKVITALIKKRHVAGHEPLHVSLEDLRSSEKRGKWWLVGAAWAGDPLTEQAGKTESSVEANEESNASLLKLATKQGMNTDVRRSIFMTLMSSDDYIDACDRLSQLNLKEVQQREIIRVILHCCGNEKVYNPFYTLAIQQLCRISHSHKVTLQFCLWDFLRNLGETNVGGADVVKHMEDEPDFNVSRVTSTRLTNVAIAYAWWVSKGSVSLTIFKPVDFLALQPRTQDFFNMFFSQLFISSQVSSPAIVVTNPRSAAQVTGSGNKAGLEEIVLTATRIPALSQGLLFFLSKTFKRSPHLPEPFANVVGWACAIATDSLRMAAEVVNDSS